jgi:16S rRNA (guanine966-N2)-methyltransferase
MRVIAGRFKGRVLASPDWAGLRPTSDKLKGTMFDILGAAITGARVLDGFAGSGALGIEALSRGASHVSFVDSDRRAAALIEENLRRCGVGEGYTMMRGELARVLGRLGTDERFDVILLDPPYDAHGVEDALSQAAARLAGGGLIILEHAWRNAPPGSSAVAALARRVRSGQSGLAIYRRPEPPRDDGCAGTGPANREEA